MTETDKSYAGSARGQKATGTKKFIITVGGAFAVIIGAVTWSLNNEINDTRLARPSYIDATPGGKIQEESELYQERLTQFNERRADQAEAIGVTYVPTPDMILRPLSDDDLLYRPEGLEEQEVLEPTYELFNVDERVEWDGKDRKPLGEPPSAAALYQLVMGENTTVGRSAFGSGGQQSGVNTSGRSNTSGSTRSSGKSAQEEEEENPFIAGITRQMGAVSKGFQPEGSRVQQVKLPEREELADEDGQPSTGEGVEGEGEGDETVEDIETEVLIQPGDILYGETLNYVTSDLDTPILVRLTTGPFAGARLTGAFQVDDASTKLFVAFSTLTFEDGETIPIQAFAVDGFTSQSTVASSVNKRYLARYGAILASSFIAGFADSASKTSENVVASGNNTIITGVAPTTKQSLYAGLAEAGSVISKDIAQRAPKGPEIIIRSGYPVGVLVVSPVSVPVENQDD